jgi:hypothetical protein
VLLAACAAAGPTPAAALQVGDCVIFREGGAGLILKSPTYWLRGSIAGITQEDRLAGRCPDLGKPQSSYTHRDWARMAAAMPCVDNDADIRTVEVMRVRMRVEDWETPWSYQHGTVGWLFRGQFLGQVLQKGQSVEMDASWLAQCQPGNDNSISGGKAVS